MSLSQLFLLDIKEMFKLARCFFRALMKVSQDLLARIVVFSL